MSPKRDDVGDLKRLSVIWVAAVGWIVLSYVLQGPARDPVDAAERTAFTYVMAVVIPVITLVFVGAWLVALRKRRG